MSDTTAVPPVRSRAADAAVAAAQDVPTLIANLKAVDPGMAEQLAGKSLAASKSPWGTVAVAGVAWASAKWGLGWDQGTCALVGGLGILVGSYLMRYVTTSPIASILPKPAT